uniref:Uncharacterized protein n=1 Tax=Romanomermis culicivorax TaxID=13658 RepID=A0A915J7D1_ROMCU
MLAAQQFGRPIEPRQVEMKQGKWPKGVLQFTNNIRDQVSHLRDYYHPRINRSIVPIVKELYEKNVNPIVYFLWPHSAQEWRVWIPGFTSVQQMEQEKPEVVIIADPPIATTPAIGSKGVTEEEKLMEIVEIESEKQPELEKLREQIKEMEEKIEVLQKEKYGKVAIELAKQLESINTEEEETSEKPFVEIMSEIGSQLLASAAVPPPTQYQMPQFPRQYFKL